MKQGFLLRLWMDENVSQQSNKKSLTKENCSYKGNRNRCAQQMKYVGNTDVFCLGFYFMSPKWTRTKLENCDISVPMPFEVYHLYRGHTDSSAHIVKFSLQSALFSLCMAMRIVFSTFWFAIFVFRVLKCDAANFDKYSSAGVNSMCISNFWCTTFT